MKFYPVLLLAALFSCKPAVQVPIDEITDIGITSVNTEKPHCTMLPYDSIGAAIKDDPAESPYFLSLNGTWKFHWVTRPE